MLCMLTATATVPEATAVAPFQKLQELTTSRLCEEDTQGSGSFASYQLSLLQMAGAFLVVTIGLLLSASTLLFELLKNGFRRGDVKESADQEQEAESETPEWPATSQSTRCSVASAR